MFATFDKDKSGTVEKPEMVDYISSLFMVREEGNPTLTFLAENGTESNSDVFQRVTKQVNDTMTEQ